MLAVALADIGFPSSPKGLAPVRFRDSRAGPRWPRLGGIDGRRIEGTSGYAVATVLAPAIDPLSRMLNHLAEALVTLGISAKSLVVLLGDVLAIVARARILDLEDGLAVVYQGRVRVAEPLREAIFQYGEVDDRDQRRGYRGRIFQPDH